METLNLDKYMNTGGKIHAETLPVMSASLNILSEPLHDENNHWREFLCVEKINNDAIIPTRGSPLSAGYDLYAYETYNLLPWSSCTAHTRIKVAFPPGVYGRIASRSGLACKNNIEVGAGVIDADYQGEIMVKLRNLSNEHFVIKKGDRIAQLILEKYTSVDIKKVSSLEQLFGKTSRGEKGFGSTGV